MVTRPQTSARHWTEIGRALAADVQGRSRSERIAIIKAMAVSMGLAAHTLQRYVVLSEFLSHLNVSEDSCKRLGVAQMEVILRIWGIDPKTAVGALRAAEHGALTFRRALELERKLKGGESGQGAGEVDSDGNISAPAPELGWILAGLTEVDLLDDPRFAFARIHRIYASSEKSLAVIDEQLAASRPGVGHEFPAFARSVLEAAALFDEVVVQIVNEASVRRLDELLKLCLPSVRARIFVVFDNLASE